ncbi:hypothetical protein GOC26_23245 [Sinorhizobium meliloti]|uniref:GIY-YIG nuclease family protein n=1 Tax=Rhizobium meliloti TaxID=382 RepID=UPI0029AF36BA|nr:hypothetical protein [Sinorhizobium meliloti]
MSVQQHIYAVRGAGMVKIGRAVAPEIRFDTLQSGSPVKLDLVGYIDGDHACERELHDRFKCYRAHGEWFRDEGPVSEWADSVKFATEEVSQ